MIVLRDRNKTILVRAVNNFTDYRYIPKHSKYATKSPGLPLDPFLMFVKLPMGSMNMRLLKYSRNHGGNNNESHWLKLTKNWWICICLLDVRKWDGGLVCMDLFERHFKLKKKKKKKEQNALQLVVSSLHPCIGQSELT